MKKNDIFIVKQTFILDNGSIPCGAIIEIIDYNTNLNKYEIIITPYIKDGERKSIQLLAEKDFILTNGEQ